jgi:predicted kinase
VNTVTVVCGPPGAGKTTYVLSRAKRGDLIVDLDRIFEAVSGLPLYDKPDALAPFVWQARDAILDRLSRPSDITNAWIITSGARRKDRAALAARLRAEIVVLDTAAEECKRRLVDRPATRPWNTLIEQWWADYMGVPRP